MNPYGVDTSDLNIRGPLISLKVLYERMPETSGCDKCPEVNGSDAYWCCRTMNPSMYYAEFLLIWEQVQKWGKRAKTDLIIKAIVNYLSTSFVKGCVFFEDKCLCYKSRPFMCRMYGIIPKETWDKRFEELTQRLGDKAADSWRSQCNLVTIDNGKSITPDDENKWFSHVRLAEERIGVPSPIINLHDIPGGSYRTFHDHILLELLSATAMNRLTQVKITKPSDKDIRDFALVLVSQLEMAGVI